MDILKEANEITLAILKMTESVIITGNKEQEETEVEAYAKLMEEREPLINKLVELKKGVDAAMASSPEFSAIRQTIEKISQMDKTHLSYIEKMYEGVQSSHKEIKVGQRIHNAYVGSPSDSSSRFDATQ
jgi:hypothetical protein